MHGLTVVADAWAIRGLREINVVHCFLQLCQLTSADAEFGARRANRAMALAIDRFC
jgi:hypothetical protein